MAEQKQMHPISKPEPKTYRDTDGTIYEWDGSMKAWFPKIDEEFIARYQMAYNNSELSNLEQENGSGIEGSESTEKMPKITQTPFEFFQQGNNKIDEIVKTAKLEGEMTIKALEKLTSQVDDQLESDSIQNTDYKSANDEPQKTDGRSRLLGDATVNLKAENHVKGWNEQANSGPCRVVYVYNLPLSTSETEFEDLISTCGVIARDPITSKLKIKFYRDKETGDFKGDAICTFVRPESVELAKQIIDKTDFKGKQIRCEEAKFELKGDYNPKLSKRRRLTKKQKEKMKASQEKIFQWKASESVTRKKSEATVIIKNCFDIKDIEQDVLIKYRLQNQLRDLASKVGEPKKINIYETNKEGVCTIRFETVNDADVFVEFTNGTIFGNKRIISSYNWDGREKFYSTEEFAKNDEERLEEFHESYK